ncbi:MAG: hypothetical protein EXR51_02715 [Dehalococcoidia bacterium]|nr:hypothetical protein [Dehalococcoidia bacterium]
MKFTEAAISQMRDRRLSRVDAITVLERIRRMEPDQESGLVGVVADVHGHPLSFILRPIEDVLLVVVIEEATS